MKHCPILIIFKIATCQTMVSRPIIDVLPHYIYDMDNDALTSPFIEEEFHWAT